MKKTALVVLAALAAGTAYGQTTYYKCEDARGQPVFSQQPCGEDAQVGTIGGSAAQDRQAADQATWERVAAGNALREAERELDRRQGRIRDLERERDNKLAALKSRSNRANNNLAGAQLIEGMATEMQAVAMDYQNRIAREEREADRLRERMDRLRAAL